MKKAARFLAALWLPSRVLADERGTRSLQPQNTQSRKSVNPPKVAFNPAFVPQCRARLAFRSRLLYWSRLATCKKVALPRTELPRRLRFHFSTFQFLLSRPCRHSECRAGLLLTAIVLAALTAESLPLFDMFHSVDSHGENLMRNLSIGSKRIQRDTLLFGCRDSTLKSCGVRRRLVLKRYRQA
jgi:hypothetical protein